MSSEVFKLDAAALFDSQSPHRRIIIYNFNVPVQRSEDPETFETIRRQIETDFPIQDQARVIVPLYFQICAVYVLVHRETGEERHWQGSFNPRSRDLGQITIFRPFDHQTFVPYALSHSRHQYVLNELNNRIEGQESVWSVDRILSIIVSIQATVRTTHIVFQRHPLLLGGGGGAGGQGHHQGRANGRIHLRLQLE